MSGPYQPNHRIRINEAIVCDLSWLLQHLQESPGVFLLDSIAWSSDEAELIIITDASLTGIGMWSPTVDIGYHAPVLTCVQSMHIFFHEAFVVCCAIHWAAQMCEASLVPIRNVVVYTDNTNTVDIFNSLKAQGVYNSLLKFAVNILMSHEFDLRVLHIPGSDNTVADLLSRQWVDEVLQVQPQLRLSTLIPPIDLVGAVLT